MVQAMMPYTPDNEQIAKIEALDERKPLKLRIGCMVATIGLLLLLLWNLGRSIGERPIPEWTETVRAVYENNTAVRHALEGTYAARTATAQVPR